MADENRFVSRERAFAKLANTSSTLVARERDFESWGRGEHCALDVASTRNQSQRATILARLICGSIGV
jgi:hypothetical protein